MILYPRVLLDIRARYSDLSDLGDKGSSRVGDFGHVRIILARHETGEGMEKLGTKLGRSTRLLCII